MAQLTIYIDDLTLKNIEKAASTEKTSISKWVSSRIKAFLKDEWSSDFIDLCGSLSEEMLSIPEDLDPSLDSKRESF